MDTENDVVKSVGVGSWVERGKQGEMENGGHL